MASKLPCEGFGYACAENEIVYTRTLIRDSYSNKGQSKIFPVGWLQDHSKKI